MKSRKTHATAIAAGLLLGAATASAAPPSPPSGMKVAPLGTTSQILTWTDNSGDETGFNIERQNGASWVPVTSVPANTTRHILGSQPTGTQTYRVTASNGDGSSAPSQEKSTLRMNVLFFLADDMGYKDIVANRNAATDGPTIYETPALDALVSQGVNFHQAYCSGPKCVVARRSIQTGMYDFRSQAVAKNGGISPQMVTIGEAMKAGGYRTCFIGKWHLGGHLDGSTGGDENDAGGSFPPGGALPYSNWSLLAPGDNKYVPATDPNHYEGYKTPAAQGYDVAIATGEWGAPPMATATTSNPQSGGYYPSLIPATSPAQYWYGLPGQIAAPDNTDPLNPIPPPAPPILQAAGANEYLTDRLTTVATGFIGDHIASGNSNQPFFLTLAHYAVHTPLQADPARVAYFEAKRASMNAQFAAHPGGAQIVTDYTSKVRQHQDQPIYAAMMDSFDDSLAAIRTYLSSTNDPRNPGMTLADTTIIVLSSDHGGKSTHFVNSADSTPIPTSNYPLRQGKTWCYEGGLKIPLIVYWPGFSPTGADTEALVNGADFYTSILDMTGSPRVPTQHLDSISFAESVVNPAYQARTDSHHWFTNADDGTGNPALGAYRFGNYKLVYHIIRRMWELYDLAEDPGELNDIASIRPDLVNEFYKRLSDRLVAVDGKRPLPGSNSWDTELLVVAPVTTIPAAVPNGIPSGLAGTAVSDTAIDLTWVDNSTDEERFIIQRKFSGSGSFVEVATVSANAPRYRDTGLTPNTTYQYRIQAENLKGWAGPSNQITVTTNSVVPLPVIARGDDITTLVNETRVFETLLNDQGKNLVITGITQPSLGTVSIVNSGTAIRFVPNPGATGEATMTYTVTDALNATATGTVLISVLADHTVAPPLVYDFSATKTNVDVWEFNDANGTTIANCANSANAALKFASGSTPTTDGAGNLRIVTSGGTGNLFRVTNSVSPGTKTLGDANAGIYELSIRFSAADLSHGDSDGAYAGFAFRDTITAGTPELFSIRLQKTATNELQLQYRNSGSVVIASIPSNTLPNGVEVRSEANMTSKTVTVYYNIGAGEILKGTYPMHTSGVVWNTYRLSASNNSTDFATGDFINIDYARIKSLVYPAPPTAFQMWMDTAQGSVTPSPDKDPGADPDHDGVKNILEYAFGGHPFDASSGIAEFPRLADTAADPDANEELVFTLPVIPGTNFSPVGGILTGSINGITTRVLGSLNLTDFTSPVEEVYPPMESGLPPVPRGWEYRSFRMPASNNATRAFMRASATSN